MLILPKNQMTEILIMVKFAWLDFAVFSVCLEAKLLITQTREIRFF